MIWLWIFLAASLLTFAWGAFVFAPWVPTRAKDVDRALHLAGDLRGKNFVELGSGDGRVTLAAAQRGASATGYEIALPLFLFAWLKSKLSDGNARFVFGDCFRADLSNADVVFFFGMPKAIAGKLRPKLERELKPEAVIISYTFEIEGLTPDLIDKPSEQELPIYKYSIKR